MLPRGYRPPIHCPKDTVVIFYYNNSPSETPLTEASTDIHVWNERGKGIMYAKAIETAKETLKSGFHYLLTLLVLS
jgi:hypothetical protein